MIKKVSVPFLWRNHSYNGSRFHNSVWSGNQVLTTVWISSYPHSSGEWWVGFSNRMSSMRFEVYCFAELRNAYHWLLFGPSSWMRSLLRSHVKCFTINGMIGCVTGSSVNWSCSLWTRASQSARTWLTKCLVPFFDWSLTLWRSSRCQTSCKPFNVLNSSSMYCLNCVFVVALKDGLILYCFVDETFQLC